MIRVLVWNEFRHEKSSEKVAAIYPKGIHGCIADFLGKEEDITVKTATLDEENCGITKELLDESDVLIWWGILRTAKCRKRLPNWCGTRCFPAWARFSCIPRTIPDRSAT